MNRFVHRTGLSILTLLAASVHAGCEKNVPAAGARGSERDSAGVTIITSQSALWSNGQGWKIADRPLLDIGADSGAVEYIFAGAHSAAQLSDGRIAVANMQTNEIRYFDAAGKFLMKTGASGHGPGEFEQLYRMKKITGDSLMALEPVSLTSIFSPDGKYVRRFDLDAVPGRANIWWLGRLESGALVAISLVREGTKERPQNPNPKPGVEEPVFDIPEKDALYRDSLMHFLYDMNGNLIDSIGKLPSQWLGENRVFPPNAAYAFSGNSFYHSPGNAIEIREFRSLLKDPAQPRPAEGFIKLERIIRTTSTSGPAISDSAKNAYVQSQRDMYKRIASQNPGMKLDMPAMERRWADTKYPPTLPAHGNRMVIDPDGNIWLQEYQMNPADRTPMSFMIFDAKGKWLGSVRMHEAFTISEIGRDYVLGVWHDEDDVEHVRKYAIVKS